MSTNIHCQPTLAMIMDFPCRTQKLSSSKIVVRESRMILQGLCPGTLQSLSGCFEYHTANCADRYIPKQIVQQQMFQIHFHSKNLFSKTCEMVNTPHLYILYPLCLTIPIRRSCRFWVGLKINVEFSGNCER